MERPRVSERILNEQQKIRTTKRRNKIRCDRKHEKPNDESKQKNKSTEAPSIVTQKKTEIKKDSNNDEPTTNDSQNH